MSIDPTIKTKLPRIIGTALLYIIGALIFLLIMRLLVLNSIYTAFLDWTSSSLGVDVSFARPLSVLLTAFGLLILPWSTLYLFLGRKKDKRRVLIAAMLGSLAFLIGTYFTTGRVYFDRNTGEYSRCYLKSLAGFKFSSTCDYDPKFGMKYQPITPQVMKEIYFWEKNGTLQKVPTVQEGKYFDQLTGEALVWYSIQPSDGKVRLFPLPGYDPLTGDQLRPIDKETVEKVRRFGFVMGNPNIKEDPAKKEARNKASTTDVVARPDESVRKALEFLTEGKKVLFFKKRKSLEYEEELNYKEQVFAWYRKQRKTPLQTDIVTIPIVEPGYRVYLDKIISLEEYTILGLSFEAFPRKITDQPLEPINIKHSTKILDSRNHEASVRATLNEGGYDITLNPGEKRLVLYILPRLSWSQLESGILEITLSTQDPLQYDSWTQDNALIKFRRDP